MSLRREQENTERVTQALLQADSRAWSNLLYPQSHRPDVNFLSEHTRIAEQLPEINFHPDMKPDVLRRSLRQTERSRVGKALIFWYDPATRELFLRREALDLPDEKFDRFTWNHAARDIVGRRESLTPAQYTDEQIKDTSDLLKMAFEPKRRPAIDDTTIVQSGFRRSLFVGSCYISDIAYPGIPHANEVYPTALEIITHEIMVRSGDVHLFDQDVSLGRVTPNTRFGEHPNFTNALIGIFKIIDWRDILTAFAKGNVDQTITFLEERAKKPLIRGPEIFLLLVSAMAADEVGIMRVNTILADGFHFPGRMNLN